MQNPQSLIENRTPNPQAPKLERAAGAANSSSERAEASARLAPELARQSERRSPSTGPGAGACDREKSEMTRNAVSLQIALAGPGPGLPGSQGPPSPPRGLAGASQRPQRPPSILDFLCGLFWPAWAPRIQAVPDIGLGSPPTSLQCLVCPALPPCSDPCPCPAACFALPYPALPFLSKNCAQWGHILQQQGGCQTRSQTSTSERRAL